MLNSFVLYCGDRRMFYSGDGGWTDHVYEAWRYRSVEEARVSEAYRSNPHCVVLQIVFHA